MSCERVLVVDDEKTIQFVLGTLMNELGYETDTVGSAEEALSKLYDPPVAVALVDIILPGMDGMGLLGRIKETSPDTEVIIMTSHASVETAVEAIRKGAYDYIFKPFELDEVSATVQRAAEKRRLTMQNRELVAEKERQNLELSAAVKRLDSLNEAGTAMSGISSLQELLDYFVGMVARELDVERTSLMLLDDEGEVLRIASARGLDDEIIESVEVHLGDGVAGQVALDGKPLLVKDINSDPRFHDLADKGLADSFLSAPVILSVPIKSMEKVLGVINVTNRQSGDAFTDEDMAFLCGLAGQAAVAIERARNWGRLQTAFESVRTMQDQLVSSERLNAVGEMAAGVAHDFNNILNGILGTAQMLAASVDEKNPERENLLANAELIEQLSLQGAETVKRVQEFARIRKDQPTEIIDLNETVKTVAHLTRPKWKEEAAKTGRAIDVQFELGEIAPVIGNMHELCQAISNLVFNAVESMPEGGSLTFRTSLEEEWVRLDVQDTGVGIPEENRDRVFEPFFSTKDSGQGLGLSVTYGIVTRLGGTLKVESTQGTGTTMMIRLRPKEQGAKKRKKAGGKKRMQKPAKILVIEDEDYNRRLYSQMLTKGGHETQAAASGSEGIAMFTKDQFDIVITDLSMPGMSGWEVSKEIKEQSPKTPVILLSGWAIQQEEEKVREAAVDCVLSKPISMKDLLSTIDGLRAA